MKLYNINNHINYSSTKIQIFLFANEQSVHNYVKSNVNKLKQKHKRRYNMKRIIVITAIIITISCNYCFSQSYRYENQPDNFFSPIGYEYYEPSHHDNRDLLTANDDTKFGTSQRAPLGSGLFILISLSIYYAMMNRRKKHNT